MAQDFQRSVSSTGTIAQNRRKSGAVDPFESVKPSPLRLIAKKLAGPRIREIIRERRNLRYHYDELNDKGWPQSLRVGQIVDGSGPIPWITYPALKFLERLVSPTQNVFEYGCGNSSLWWSKRVRSIISVEHSPEWAANISKLAPPQLRVVLRQMNEAADPELLAIAEEFFAQNPALPTSGYASHDVDHGLRCREFMAYAAEIGKYGRDHFDVVVVDGMARGLATWMAVNFIKKDGFIVFDNSDRWQYNCAFKILSEHGFKRIDFQGLGPGRPIEWCTTIYLRSLDAVPLGGELTVGQLADLGW